MLSRKIRTFSALFTSSVGLVMLYLIVTQLIPYITAGGWDILIAITGKFFDSH